MTVGSLAVLGGTPPPIQPLNPNKSSCNNGRVFIHHPHFSKPFIPPLKRSLFNTLKLGYPSCSVNSSFRLKKRSTFRHSSALDSDIPLHQEDNDQEEIISKKNLQQWDSLTAKFAGAANVPFLLLQLPQIVLNARNLLAGNNAALFAVPWLGMFTGLLGNLSLLSYFAKKRETEVVVVQTLGVVSTYAVITQLAMAGSMPLPQFAATSLVVACGLLINFLYFFKLLHHIIWNFWEDFITVAGLSALPQVMWSTFVPYVPNSILPGIVSFLIAVVAVIMVSPDARRRIMQIPHGNGYSFSPAGNFAPMSLGTSPSQFTPPFSQVTTVSPGHYGPSSPARGNCHGSPLGKGTGSVNQLNRRKGWAYSGSLQSSQESTSSGQHWQGGQFSDVNTSSGQGDMGSPPVLGRSMHHLQPNLNGGNWKQQQRSSGNGGGHGSFGSGKPFPHGGAKSAVHDKPESSSSLPDPGDWDPNYSDELLLQDDSSELSSMTTEFSKSMHLNQPFAPTESFMGVARFNQMSTTNMSMQRPNGPIQAFSHAEAGSSVSSSPDVYVHPMMTPSHLMPHFSQFSPSRLGQQPVQRFTHGRSMGIRGAEWNHVKVQAPLSNFNSGGPRSPGSNSAPWGRRGNHPIAANILPSSHGGNEYGRIA